MKQGKAFFMVNFFVSIKFRGISNMPNSKQNVEECDPGIRPDDLAGTGAIGLHSNNEVGFINKINLHTIYPSLLPKG